MLLVFFNFISFSFLLFFFWFYFGRDRRGFIHGFLSCLFGGGCTFFFLACLLGVVPYYDLMGGMVIPFCYAVMWRSDYLLGRENEENERFVGGISR